MTIKKIFIAVKFEPRPHQPDQNLNPCHQKIIEKLLMLISTLLVAFFATLAFAFNAGEFVEIDAPETKNHGKICVVENTNYFHPDAPEIPRVSVFAFDDKELKKYGEEDVTVKNVIKYLAVLDSQLKPISRNFFTAPLSDDQKFRLAKVIFDNLKGETKSFRSPKLEFKHRLIGAWIDYTYGFDGMVAVCDSLPLSLRRTAESFWNNIGDFLG